MSVDGAFKADVRQFHLRNIKLDIFLVCFCLSSQKVNNYKIYKIYKKDSY